MTQWRDLSFRSCCPRFEFLISFANGVSQDLLLNVDFKACWLEGMIVRFFK
jgi:hypothetical protein